MTHNIRLKSVRDFVYMFKEEIRKIDKLNSSNEVLFRRLRDDFIKNIAVYFIPYGSRTARNYFQVWTGLSKQLKELPRDYKINDRHINNYQ